LCQYQLLVGILSLLPIVFLDTQAEFVLIPTDIENIFVFSRLEKKKLL